MPATLINGSDFLAPIFALMGLTVLVWFYMYFVRIRYMMQNKIDPESLKTEKGKLQLDGPQNYPADNFNHLFEIPVLFYVTSILFVVTGKGDDLSLNLAWIYVALRLMHSAIQCSYNGIRHRFAVFVVSSIALFAYMGKAASLML